MLAPKDVFLITGAGDLSYFAPVKAEGDLAGLFVVHGEGGVARRQGTGWRGWGHFSAQMEACKKKVHDHRELCKMDMDGF